MLPPVVIEKVGKIYVARDDLLPGGTKRRAVHVFMDDGDELVYASPAQGYAQLALAHGRLDNNIKWADVDFHHRKLTIFVAQRKELHPLTKQAHRLGAEIIQVPMGFLSNVTAKAKQYVSQTPGAVLLPFGLKDERFINALADAMWNISIRIQPSELWCVASSGTLASAMRLAWPGVPLNCIQVGHKVDISNINLHVAPERYEQPAKIKPPFPSCINYDAKAWRFIIDNACPGALFWNVGA